MSLPLPPKSSCVPSDAGRVHTLLDSVIAYRPAATTTYLFYEEIDAWLGPWGMAGYPIGYGKKYNNLFTTNPPLNRDMIGRDWVRNTTILLQEAIRDYIVLRVRSGTIGSLTETELRDAAFDSHPDAYLKGGLLGVIEHSPELLFVILTIPIEEFSPFNPNFQRTINQIIKVISTPSLISLLRTANGALFRSNYRTILMRFAWEELARRVPGMPPLPPAARDDNLWDKLGLAGGLVNMFER